MLKKTITYEDYDGNTRTEDFYFNVTRSELVELEVSEEEGFGEFLKNIAEADNNQQIIAQFKKIILLSYGKKSEDGRKFVKNQELRDEFEQTAAYSDLFMELTTVESAGVNFINSVMPAGLVAEMASMPDVPVVPTAPPVLENTTTNQKQMVFSDYSREQLLAMSDEQFNELTGGGNPIMMTQPMLVVAMQRKTKQ